MKTSKNIKSYKRLVNNKLKYFGETDLGKKTVTINKSKKKNNKGDILDSIVHEKNHVLHPKASEKTIVKMTQKKTQSMSKSQKQKHYKLFKA